MLLKIWLIVALISYLWYFYEINKAENDDDDDI